MRGPHLRTGRHVSPDTNSASSFENMRKRFQLSLSDCFLWQVEWAKIRGTSRGGMWGSCSSGRNRDDVNTARGLPEQTGRKLWVGVCDNTFKGIAGLAHSRYSSEGLRLAFPTLPHSIEHPSSYFRKARCLEEFSTRNSLDLFFLPSRMSQTFSLVSPPLPVSMTIS